jgi:4'-phosphopantetheinyl transferase EntD
VKESVYKCIYASVERFVDFREVSIDRTETRDSTIRLAPVSGGRTDLDVVRGVRARYLVTRGLVVTLAWLPT